MRICPKCRTAYPAKGRATCQRDGTRLVDAEEYAESLKDPLIGKLISGRFHVRERIGTGGMGTVYRADQVGLDRPVALKVLKKELSNDRETVARFHREAKAMSMLVHANTVRVFDFGEDEDGYLYLAMEMLEGELLTSWAEREVTPPITHVIHVIRLILRSLNEAHSKGLIHRDLKPDNIYLANVEGHAHPVVKVLDFGIAKVFRGDRKIDDLETQAGTVFGTPRYMSPEQAQGKKLDHRSDLYTVGVLLYQLLTGAPPFIDDDAVVVMAKHIREVPPSPRKVAAEQPIPRSLDKVVMTAIEKEPDDRYDNADAFETALKACLADVETEAARMASGPRSGFIDMVGSLPRIPLAIGSAVVLASVGAAIVLVFASGPVATEPDANIPAGSPPLGGASPPQEEPTPPTVTEVRLESDPAGAQILRYGQDIGETPHNFALNAGQTMRLTVQLEGHVSQTVELTPDSGPTHTITLAAIEPEVRPATKTQGRRRRGSRQQPRADTYEPAQSGDPYERWND